MVSRFTVPTATVGQAPSHSPPDVHYAPGIELARCLGWFSIALGAAQFLAPEQMARCTGVRHPNLMRACGMREIATGVGVLTSPRPSGWLWGRVAGDVVDLAVLGETIAEGSRADRKAAAVATIAVAGVLAADIFAAFSLGMAKRLEG